jgi:hypothetical protein
MSNYLWQIIVDKHDKEIALGIDLGASWYYKTLRISISFMHRTIHIGIDRKYENV